MNKWHIEVKREFDSTWKIMEQEHEPTEAEIIKFLSEKCFINDDPEYMEFLVTKI